MPITQQLIDILKIQDIPFRVLTHSSVVTIEDVENILGIKPELMAKALVVKTSDGFAVAVIPGNCQLSKKDLAKLSGYSRSSLDMVRREEVEKITGLPLGSIPPYGLGFPVFMDEKLLTHKLVYCGIGSLTQTLEISPIELYRLSGAKTGSITR